MEREIKQERQGRISDSAVLDYMTKPPARVSAGLYSLIGIGLLAYGYATQAVYTGWGGIALFGSAVFFWTFFEYIFHRYVNHLDKFFPDSVIARRIAYTIHGIHHKYPRDVKRLIMPPIPGLMMVAVLFLFFLTMLGQWAYIFMPGFMSGYLFYAYVHYHIHKRKAPKWLKVQYRHHALHHYKYPEKAFGVSSTFWDHVFGTMPPDH